MPVHHWSHLRTTEIAALGAEGAVALQPVGALEQHGPHLPLGTDLMLAQDMAEAAAARARVATVILLPVQTIGASEEHHDFPGTVWLAAEDLIACLMAVGRGAAAAGIGKLVFLNAHGGNVPALHIACRRLRIAHGLFAASAGWMALGIGEHQPEHRRDDIHGGFMETAAMLHLRPELVDMAPAEDFVPSARDMADEWEHLRMMGAVTTGWTARDLHPAGVAGNAAAATAEAGRVIVETAAARLGTLLDEVAAHRPDWQAR